MSSASLSLDVNTGSEWRYHTRADVPMNNVIVDRVWGPRRSRTITYHYGELRSQYHLGESEFLRMFRRVTTG